MTTKYARRTILRNAASGGVALVVGADSASLAQPEPQRPNTVFIIADDMGYADISCNGRPDFMTPNIDRIAAQGARFSQAYANSPVCTASRLIPPCQNRGQAGSLGRRPANIADRLYDQPSWRSGGEGH